MPRYAYGHILQAYLISDWILSRTIQGAKSPWETTDQKLDRMVFIAKRAWRNAAVKRGAVFEVQTP